MNPNMLRRWAGAMALVAGAAFGSAALAHDYRAGDVRIGHPYATPTLAGASHGAAYIATLENTGAKPDRLLRAGTPLAGRVELHNMTIDAGGVMRMRMLDDITVTPGSPIKMRPGQGLHFMLMELKQPSAALKEFETSQVREPNRLRAYAGAAAAADAAGERDKARAHYARLVELTRDADTALPEVSRAKTWLAQK